MADGVAVENRGKPAVTIVGHEFLRGAEMKRKALGLPTLPLQAITVPDNEPAAREQARAIADAIAEALTNREASS